MGASLRFGLDQLVLLHLVVGFAVDPARFEPAPHLPLLHEQRGENLGVLPVFGQQVLQHSQIPHLIALPAVPCPTNLSKHIRKRSILSHIDFHR